MGRSALYSAALTNTAGCVFSDLWRALGFMPVWRYQQNTWFIFVCMPDNTNATAQCMGQRDVNNNQENGADSGLMLFMILLSFGFYYISITAALRSHRTDQPRSIRLSAVSLSEIKEGLQTQVNMCVRQNKLTTNIKLVAHMPRGR